jgi:hypothetical protein
VSRRPGKEWESRFPALSVAVDSHGASACMEPEQQERREKWKAMKPLQPVFSSSLPPVSLPTDHRDNGSNR